MIILVVIESVEYSTPRIECRVAVPRKDTHSGGV